MIPAENLVTVPASRFAKYDDLIFSPLDMPKPPAIDSEQFVQWMLNDPLKTGAYPKQHYEKVIGRPYPWLMRVLRNDFTPLADAYPDVLEYVLKYPVRNVQNIIFLAQDGHQAVFTHTDSDGLIGLRFYLANKNVDGLHFYRGRERYDYFNTYQRHANGEPKQPDLKRYFDMDKKVYATFPEECQSFVLNSARAAHGVDANTCKLGDRIAVLVQGEIDMERYEALVETSLKKFGNHAIWY